MKQFEIKELAIKNMICSRCLKVIRLDLEPLGVEVIDMKLGKVKIKYSKADTTISEIEEALKKDDFELIQDKEKLISEQVKLVIIKMVNDLPLTREKKLSVLLRERLQKDYWTLSKIFSKTENITIEKYFILIRIEKVKELIEYDQMNFSGIAYELGYNNLFHLSGQFKRIVGMSMSEFKKQGGNPRGGLDKIM